MTDDLIDRLHTMGSYGHKPYPTHYINPDGPEAAKFIAAQAARIAALGKALERLEAACDTIAGLRTQEMYLAMIDAGQGDALSELGDARQAARALLNPTPTEER